MVELVPDNGGELARRLRTGAGIFPRECSGSGLRAFRLELLHGE